MDVLNTYIEMMGDMEFAISVAIFVFGLILLIGLIAKLAQDKKSVVPAEKPKEKPASKPAELAPVVNAAPKKEDAPVASPAPVAPAVAAPPAASLEGVMMWEGDDGKKKKSKSPPPPPPKSAAAPAPSAVVNKTEPAAPASAPSATPPEDKTLILTPKSAETLVKPAVLETGAPPAKPVPPAATPEAAPSAEKSFIDLQMYELLVRRISGIEADVKRDPLFLDPLMKRIGQMEKRVEEALARPSGGGAEKSVAPDGDLRDLKEKVDRLQKLIEHLSEGFEGPKPS